MSVRFYSDGAAIPAMDRRKIRTWLRNVAETEGFRFGDVNYIFCSPERHLSINRQFLGHDYATDVITFDYTAERKVGGDVFVDPQTVTLNANDLGIDPRVEMRRVMVHGVLHLCGHGDKSADQQREMRRLENNYLRIYYGNI